MGDLASASDVKPSLAIMVMRIQTKFTSEDDFVAGFRRFCTETSCFIPSTDPRIVGIETGFSIRLADGTPMLRGLCVVLDSWMTGDNPFGRPGVRLGLRMLTHETKPIFDRILLARVAVGSSPDLRASIDPELDKKTVEMPPLFPELPAADCTHEDTSEELAADGIPVAIEAHDGATERMLIDTVPMRAPVATLLGVAPIAIPRTVTPRERVTMPALTPTGSQVVLDEPAVIVDASPPRAIAIRRSRWRRFVSRVRAWWRTLGWRARR